MFGKSMVCVCYGYFIESGIIGQFGCFEQKFQVYYVVNDNWIFLVFFILLVIVFYILVLNDFGIRVKMGIE